jgi:hypothetical protein
MRLDGGEGDLLQRDRVVPRVVDPGAVEEDGDPVSRGEASQVQGLLDVVADLVVDDDAACSASRSWIVRAPDRSIASRSRTVTEAGSSATGPAGRPSASP